MTTAASLHTDDSLKAIDASHHLHPFTNTHALNTKGARVITRAQGVYLWDSEGHKILDGMAGLWCVNMGYGRKELINAAHQQLEVLPFYNTFFQTSHEPVIKLAQAIAEITPADLNHVFFANSGSEAVDTLIRLVRHYWSLEGKPSKNIIIARENAYHGSTIAGSSLGGMSGMHKQGGPWVPNIERIRQPYYYGEADNQEQSPEAFGLACARALEDKILEVGAENVAAFIGEPVQGAGGVIVPPNTYWPEIQLICKKYDILLASDEVICGFGRTGYWFGCENFGFTPDIMTMAKGLSSGYMPISAVAINDRMTSTLLAHDDDFNHGFTYSGHPVAAAVALANIRLMQQEDIINHVHSDTAPYFQQRIREALKDHPLVGHIEGVGLLAGIALVQDKSTRTLYPDNIDIGLVCRDHCFENGLIMRAVGSRMVLSPPLVITHDQIDELCEKARLCFDLTLASAQQRCLA